MMKSRLFFFMATLLLTSMAQGLPLREVSKKNVLRDMFSLGSTEECEGISCTMLKKHLKRDSKSCLVLPSEIQSLKGAFDINGGAEKKITGRIRYVGLLPFKYSYKGIEKGGEVVIKARVYFKNYKKFSSSDLELMRADLKYAAEIWTDAAPSELNVRFDFDLTTNKKEADVSPKLQRKLTRGPYFRMWSLNWGPRVIAHEMGHVLGLDDEYANRPILSSTKNCSPYSLMCNPHRGTPTFYQYYVVLRRFFCE